MFARFCVQRYLIVCAHTMKMNKRMCMAPIVMIAYNRPDLVRLSMKNVALANRAADHEIFMFIDGPRVEGDKVKQDAIHTIVASYQSQLPKLKIVRREKNYERKK